MSQENVESCRRCGRLSRAPVESPPFAQIIEFREGRFLRIDNHSEVETALKAAGFEQRSRTRW